MDVNNSPMALSMAQEVIYLVEPSTIKLNELVSVKKNAFLELKDKKVILNKSLLSSKDVSELQYETKLNYLFNMPPLNERDKNIPMVDEFLVKLGFLKLQD